MKLLHASQSRVSGAFLVAAALFAAPAAGIVDAPVKAAEEAAAEQTTAEAGASVRPHAGMLRYPDASATHVVFVYANDLWLVPRVGGQAVPLASPPGTESFPKFSPDGTNIAFVGNYDGNRDLYTISIDGGDPTRVTHHPGAETLCGWTPDGEQLVFYTSGHAGLRRQMQLFTVDADGGLPEKLPVPYGANAAVSPDGKSLAYTPHTRDARTWKRYRGGMATNIWLFDLENHDWKEITDWEGTDTLPMWHGKTLYYLSDQGPEERLNIWSYNTETGAREQVTSFSEFDVKWPSVGPGAAGQGEIVFQNGPELYLLDLASRRAEAIEVLIPGDRPAIRPKRADVSKRLAAGNISSTGKRVVLEARGDIWTAPAENGSPRNLTRSSGSAERDPAWSPDGRWIAYFCDATDEYELYITQSDGKGETKKLTEGGDCYRYSPTWSPDSKHIAFTDKTGAIHLHTLESGKTRQLDVEPWSRPPRLSWSHDSNWLAYTKGGENRNTAVWLYDLANDEKHQVTSGMFSDTWPTFDRKGDYLFMASNRRFSSPIYEDLGTTFVYANTDVLLAVPLRDDVGSPFAPKVDEETWKDDDEDKDAKDDDSADDKDSDDDKDKENKDAGDSESDEKDEKDSDEEKSGDKDKEDEDAEPLVIDLDGFERRAIPLPVKPGAFTNLSVSHDGKLLYTRGTPRGAEGDPSIKIFDLTDDKKEEKTVLAGAGQFRISADGKKLLVRKGPTMAVVSAAAGQKLDKPVSLSGLVATIDPREEWKQMFTEAWRIQRDFFYDPTMHGVDWPAVRKRYEAMLADCNSREDVNFVLGEMISELNVGHTYVRGGGDVEDSPEVSVGMLGCDFELVNGAYRIAKIHEGAPWDIDARGPLSQPGVDVAEGDYLLAVDGIELDSKKDPWAAFQGLSGRAVTLTVSKNPKIDDEAREVVIKPLASDGDLRYRSWIEHNRAYVEKESDGRVGYIYVPNTGINGQNDLFRQFYGQLDKKALIIDERWNGGGQIPTRFIELLNRPVTNYWARRDGRDWAWPPDAHQGPKCMLINGLAGSGGDAFPAYFRQAGLGKLIGMRTWGGLVGISGNPQLIDGGYVSAPTFAYYENDGTWGIEGHGVDADIEVIDDPSKMVDGGDPQLDAAIEHMLAELQRNPYEKPERPEYPDRSGLGIREEDK